MEISFRTRKLQRICSKESEMVKSLGMSRARKLKQRMAELKAADCLADISHLPPTRLHLLEGDLDGHFSVDLQHPFRLLFIVGDDPIPFHQNGGIDKSQVLSVVIVDITDTHG